VTTSSSGPRGFAVLQARLAGWLAPKPEEERRLRRMKAGATALVTLALLAYLLSYLGPGSNRGVGFLRAASEAAMVGGLADWFAVTALFRRPMGLPIPHTALIPTRKEALARQLGEFVTTNFLTFEVLRHRIHDVDVVGRIGAWLGDPGHAAAIAGGSATVAAGLLENVAAESVAAALLAAVKADMGQRSYAQQAGQLLRIAFEAEAHVPVVTLVLEQGVSWLDSPANQDRAIHFVRDKLSGVARLIVRTAPIRRGIEGLGDALRAAVGDPKHRVRQDVDGLILGLADRLQTGGELGLRLDDAARSLVDAAAVRRWLTGQVDGTVAALRGLLTADVTSEPVRRLTALLQAWGRRAADDPVFRGRIDSFVDRVVLRTLETHAPEFASLIVEEVRRWDPREAARRIEVSVGRDLQFIRVNGTVVGAVAGVVIHVIALLIG
jgi:uncharacterized membrane-anchored protein YjiN (DUF445 family)